MAIELGIFTSTFVRPTLADRLDAAVAHGLRAVQLNLSCAGLPALPEEIAPADRARIRADLAARGVVLAALSGTFNMAHPDAAHRADGGRRLAALIRACPDLGATVVTLCTGTRDPDDMWRVHPANDAPDAWRDLVETLAPVVAVAEEVGVTLAVEPEPGNVIRTPEHARDLLREIGSPRLGIVLDPANLVGPGEEQQLPERLDTAFALLGDRIVAAHGKDRGADGEVRPAGEGLADWARVVDGLRAVGFDGALVLHGLAEDRVGPAVAHLRAVLAAPG